MRYEFILCTSGDLRQTTEAIEKGRQRLFRSGISFTVLDRTMVCSRLQAHPDLVSGFFGPVWVDAFCAQSGTPAMASCATAPSGWRETLDDVLSRTSEVEWIPGARKKQPNNLRLMRNPHFCGRDEELEQMRYALERRVALAVTQAVAAHGLGGIGKTQVANEYAWRFAASHSALLWISADSPHALFHGLAAPARTGLLGKLKTASFESASSLPLNKLAATALQWLEGNSGWLLVLDNADTQDGSELIAALLPRLRLGHVIATSRLSTWHETIAECRLGVLTLDKSTDSHGRPPRTSQVARVRTARNA